LFGICIVRGSTEIGRCLHGGPGGESWNLGFSYIEIQRASKATPINKCSIFSSSKPPYGEKVAIGCRLRRPSDGPKGALKDARRKRRAKGRSEGRPSQATSYGDHLEPRGGRYSAKRIEK
jgi:hypothetical protein